MPSNIFELLNMLRAPTWCIQCAWSRGRFTRVMFYINQLLLRQAGFRHLIKVVWQWCRHRTPSPADTGERVCASISAISSFRGHRPGCFVFFCLCHLCVCRRACVRLHNVCPPEWKSVSDNVSRGGEEGRLSVFRWSVLFLSKDGAYI